MLAMAIGAASITQFSRKPSAQPPRVAKPLSTLKPRDLQEQVAEQGILGGMRAGKEVLAAAKNSKTAVLIATIQKGEPIQNEPQVERTDHGYRVTGAWSQRLYVLPQDEEAAKEDARHVALARLSEELGGLEPAVEESGFRVVKPSPDQQKLLAANDEDGANRAWVVLDVQTSDEAIRAERSKARFGQIALWVGASFLVLLVGYGFLRLDLLTKGYLTTMLAVIAALIVGGIIVVTVVG